MIYVLAICFLSLCLIVVTGIFLIIFFRHQCCITEQMRATDGIHRCLHMIKKSGNSQKYFLSYISIVSEEEHDIRTSNQRMKIILVFYILNLW